MDSRSFVEQGIRQGIKTAPTIRRSSKTLFPHPTRQKMTAGIVSQVEANVRQHSLSDATARPLRGVDDGYST